MKPCRECRQDVSEQAMSCPHCGCPYPSKAHWDGWGIEYKSKASLAGLPWLHISFKFRPNRTPVVAKGIIAIGQFAVGWVTVAQFSIGLFSLAQFTLAGYAIAQFALAYSFIAQMGVYLHGGKGQFVFSLMELIQKLT